MLPLYFVSRVKQMISEGTESNLPPKSCTWRGQSTVSYKEKSLYCFNMISTWIARWSLEIKGSSSKLRLTRSMNSVVKWEIIASFSYDLYLDHRMALGDRGWYLKWPRDELNQLVRNISKRTHVTARSPVDKLLSKCFGSSVMAVILQNLRMKRYSHMFD